MYKSAKEPWVKQREALKKMRGQEAFALLMAMRVGKTKVLLDDYGRLEDEKKIDDLLVIAPAGVYHTWETAIEEHVGDTLRNRLQVFTWGAGDGLGKMRELERFLKYPRTPRILLMNVEALSRVKRAQIAAVAFTKARRTMIAVDESTSIKSVSANRAKFVANALRPLATYRRILSGLPTPKSPLDLFQQFFFLDPRILGFRNFPAFRARYAIVKKMDFGGRWPAPIVVGYKNTEELQSLIEPYSFRCTLEDCYDIPPKMYQFRDVEMTDEQKRIYTEFKKNATAKLNELGDYVTSTIVISQILRLHQILLGHVKDENGEIHLIPENRTAELISILEEHEGKAIIWCSYDIDVRKVSEAIEWEFGRSEGETKAIIAARLNRGEGKAVARFWGGNKASREVEEKRFLRDPACQFMIATAAAGGRGRTWTVADLIIYYSNTNDLEHRSQSEERAQAVGKKDSVLYIDLRVQNTVEDKIITGLRKKIDLASVVTGDAWREWLI